MPDGPSLQQYVETRFNLVNEDIKGRFEELYRFLAERDRRYEERHGANEQALTKVATDLVAKFAGVNEFRGAMGDAQRLFIPRAEVDEIKNNMNDKYAALAQTLDRLQSERAGIKGGYGYAVGAVGFVLSIVSFGLLLMKALNP